MASRVAGEDKMNAIIQCTIYINDMGTTRGENIFLLFPITGVVGCLQSFHSRFSLALHASPTCSYSRGYI
jgi:hypothetical protein